MLLKRKKDRDTWAPRLFELDGETLKYFVKVCWVMVFIGAAQPRLGVDACDIVCTRHSCTLAVS